MKLQTLTKKLKKYPYVTGAFFCTQAGSRKTVKNQLVKWVKNGSIIRLRRGLYTLNNDERTVGLSKLLVANILYHPSYISLESALSYWGIIPEAVFSVTSVTPKKTQGFSNQFGTFVYKSLKRHVFFGYVSVKDEFDCDVLIATPEKALLDFFYLKTRADIETRGEYFEESLRLQNIEQVNIRELKDMAGKFKSVKINKILKAFLKWREGR